MISNNVINSARFLKMPSETQALYFHLCMGSDDDWVCEAFSVMRLVWSSEDNIRVLQAKGFVKILNEDLVSYIMDWNEHNMLRADRKINSLYRELLLQVMPWIELLEPKQRADRKKSMWIWYSGTSHGQPKDGVVEGSIDKVRIDKYRIVKRKKWLSNLFISVIDNDKLLDEWWTQVILDWVYDSIENYAKNTSYTSLYFTAKNRLKGEKKPKTNNKNDINPDLLSIFDSWSTK